MTASGASEAPEQLGVRLSWPGDTVEPPPATDGVDATLPEAGTGSVAQALDALEQALLTRMDRAGAEMRERTVQDCQSQLQRALDELVQAADRVVVERRGILEQSAAAWRSEIDTRASALRTLLERAGQGVLDDLERGAADAMSELRGLAERRHQEIAGQAEGHSRQLEAAIERRVADITATVPTWVEAMEKQATDRNRELQHRIGRLTRLAIASLILAVGAAGAAVVAIVNAAG